jgi:DNA-directed RNA polymerase specialized sigma24 family protein
VDSGASRQDWRKRWRRPTRRHNFWAMKIARPAGTESKNGARPPAGDSAYLLQYCWLMLGDSAAARDAAAGLLARAGGAALASGGREARVWFLIRARASCLRRPESAAGEVRRRCEPLLAAGRGGGWADSPPAMAANAVLSLPGPEREALALLAWHGLTTAEAALVTGLAPARVAALFAAARARLPEAVAGEILARANAGDCSERAGMLRGRPAVVTPRLRGLLLAHARACPACGRHLPAQVSEWKVCSLLPFGK